MMLKFLGRIISNNLILKMVSLVLAVGIWFYIAIDLDKGAEDERLILHPSYGMVTKRLAIKAVVVGNPRQGYRVDEARIAIAPEYCIVVGPRSLLGNIKYIYTMPIDVSGEDRTVTRSVPLKSAAEGVRAEETLVTATVPIEGMRR